jgi:hypothetical protein
LLRTTILTGVIFAAAYALGQNAASSKPNAANGVDAPYSNECLALVYRPPDGWKFAQAKAIRQSNQQMSLFKIQKHSASGSAESLELDVLQPPLEHPNMERFTILLALSLVHVNSAENKITRNAYPVTIADRNFYRSDLRSGERSISLFTTWYRGYSVVAWASADLPQDLEDAANALRALSFGEDKRTADCFGPSN